MRRHLMGRHLMRLLVFLLLSRMPKSTPCATVTGYHGIWTERTFRELETSSPGSAEDPGVPHEAFIEETLLRTPQIHRMHVNKTSRAAQNVVSQQHSCLRHVLNFKNMILPRSSQPWRRRPLLPPPPEANDQPCTFTTSRRVPRAIPTPHRSFSG